jgi:hypothetical protein
MSALRASLCTFCVAGSVGCAKLLAIDHDYGERVADAGELDDAGDVRDANDGRDAQVEDGGRAPDEDGGFNDAAGDASNDANAPASFDCEALAGSVWSDHCYFAIAAGTGLDWSRAKTTCESFSGSHLVTITSAEEQAAIENAFFPSITDYWIGLSLEGAAAQTPPSSCKTAPESCPFLWVTGEALGFTLWARRSGSGQEPNYTGACVRLVLTDRSWADFGCGTQLTAICEHD